jgi:hypothetical protein
MPGTGLHEGEIGFVVFGRFAQDLLLLARGKLRLELLRDLLRQVGLNCEYVGQFPIIIFRPKVPVRLGIDQLHVQAHPIALPTHTSFQDRADAQCLADLPRAGRIATVAHHRGA